MFQGRRKFRYAVFYSLLTACAWAATEALNGTLTPEYEVTQELADLIIRPFTSVSLLVLVAGLIGFFAYTVLDRTEDMMIANERAEAANHAKKIPCYHEPRTADPYEWRAGDERNPVAVQAGACSEKDGFNYQIVVSSPAWDH